MAKYSCADNQLRKTAHYQAVRSAPCLEQPSPGLVFDLLRKRGHGMLPLEDLYRHALKQNGDG